ncbi:MAG: cytochrome b [Alphaproteobacteria bacterium]
MSIAAAGEPDRYNVAQRWLHWLVAIFVLGNLAGGATLWAFGFEGLSEGFGMATANAVFTAHKTSGVIVLALVLVRIAFRSRYGSPPPAASMSPAVWRLARSTHLTLYALLVAVPVLGWAATAAGGFPVEFFAWNLPGLVPENEALSDTLFALHGIVGLVLAVVIAVHVAGALRHRLILQDGVFRRITLP